MQDRGSGTPPSGLAQIPVVRLELPAEAGVGRALDRPLEELETALRIPVGEGLLYGCEQTSALQGLGRLPVQLRVLERIQALGDRTLGPVELLGSHAEQRQVVGEVGPGGRPAPRSLQLVDAALWVAGIEVARSQQGPRLEKAREGLGRGAEGKLRRTSSCTASW